MNENWLYLFFLNEYVKMIIELLRVLFLVLIIFNGLVIELLVVKNNMMDFENI